MRGGHGGGGKDRNSDVLLPAVVPVTIEQFEQLLPDAQELVSELQSSITRFRAVVFIATIAELISTLAVFGLPSSFSLAGYNLKTSEYDCTVLCLLAVLPALLACIRPVQFTDVGFWTAFVRLNLLISKALSFEWWGANDKASALLVLGLSLSAFQLLLFSRTASRLATKLAAEEWIASNGEEGTLPELEERLETLALLPVASDDLEGASGPLLVKRQSSLTSLSEEHELTVAKFASITKPYFWPKSHLAKLRCLATFGFLGGSKFCALSAPIFIGRAVTALGVLDTGLHTVYGNIAVYCLLMFCAKVCSEAQNVVYIRVKQNAFVEIAARAFEHVHALSLEWHLKKKMGVTLRAMDRGIQAADTVVSYLFLYLGPSFLELCVVVYIMHRHFQVPELASIAFLAFVLYATLTIKLTLWRRKFRESANKSDNDFRNIATESLMNFESVKYFNAEKFEVDRYTQSVVKFQSYSLSMQVSLSLLNSSQQLVIALCQCFSLIVAAHGVSTGALSVGSFVSVQVYIIQLFGPLSFLGTIYNAVIQAFVDMRNLSELLAERPDIKDLPTATDLVVPPQGASVEFRDVFFRYPTQSSGHGLKNISFKIEPGTETAICGESGSGKSTITRLLFRFYDLGSGQILVAGRSLRDVRQASLRAAIGVVPQDVALFNNTIMFNVKYGKREASDEEVYEACRRAQILDKILAMPMGFDTVVGERGLKLAGGEKQRMAIARCFLKNAPIVVADEWSSSLDVTTERSVHESLAELTKMRTVLVVAHRLTTISRASQILVMESGSIIERGTHAELLARVPTSRYASMWANQPGTAPAVAASVEVSVTPPSTSASPHE